MAEYKSDLSWEAAEDLKPGCGAYWDIHCEQLKAVPTAFSIVSRIDYYQRVHLWIVRPEIRIIQTSDNKGMEYQYYKNPYRYPDDHGTYEDYFNFSTAIFQYATWQCLTHAYIDFDRQSPYWLAFPLDKGIYNPFLALNAIDASNTVPWVFK